ncbi:MAG: AMP-binding protein [Actinobacteria bacterium]|nr:AMP-binding protein [Actinomycetota bacterium]MCL5447336.1 AMP-binding protein [Actinomycetota bacterium]
MDLDTRNRNIITRLNMGDTLTRTAWRMPEKLAIVDGGKRLTYGELNEHVNQLANSLANQGYSRGGRLSILAGNSLEFVLTYYACAKLGVVCVPINTGWQAAEIAYVLDHCKARGIVVESQLVANVLLALDSVSTLSDVILAPGIGDGDQAGNVLMGIRPAGFHRFWDLLSEGNADEPQVYIEDRDPLTYLYTSGTTSAPKGVVGSHLSIYLESMTCVVESGFTAKERTAAMMPFFHTAQLNGVITPAIAVGGTIFVMRTFDPAALLELVEREKITFVFGLPMMYRIMIDHPDIHKRDLSSLRRALYAMAPMPDKDLKRAIETFKCEFALGFGQTEMAPLTTVFKPEDQLSYPGSVGSQIVNVQTAVMDENGGILAPGEVGEIVYRGPHAMEGYLHDEEATSTAFQYGWFHSGDTGHFDEHGILWFDDRTKDVIKTGGENVASIEVEKAIYAAEEGIMEVVVIGLPHDRWGEAITAVAIPRPGVSLDPEQVIAKTKQQIASFKAPKAVIFVDEMPRTATGKVQKHVLRKQFYDFYQPA